ncbi:MAG: phospho-sugar mutase [Ruminococcus sp.]|nr:phospho-sugar mutase [Ruminococcus sp.]
MTHTELYNEWLKKATEDADLQKELLSIEGDENAIYERFYTTLKFGTAGLRGTIGAGTNRMNIYVVRQATQGLANFVLNKYGKGAVAISHDSRIKADLFMIEAARVLAANGIKTYITGELQPTPVLSYLVRYFKCQAGIMVTASHNPAKYNGYKAYGEDGCQMTDNNANAVYTEIQKLDMFEDIKLCDFDEAVKNGLIEYVDGTVYDDYLVEVEKQQVNPGLCKTAPLKVVYTPLNGAGNILVRRALADIGVTDVHVVKEQEMPDGNFTTCPKPNPELPEALELALKLCDEVKPDLLLATDPDSDRVAIAAPKPDGSYRLFSGNETGAMLTEYILSCRKAQNNLPENPVLVKTIVTTKLIDSICKKYGFTPTDVLTGFKYIGEVILGLEQKGEEDRYVFGFEESCGYLSGTYVRDKDAVVASMLICEMAAYYRAKDISLCALMDSIYEEHSYFINKTLNFDFEGASGMTTMAKIMTDLRNDPPKTVAGFDVVASADYLESVGKDLLTGETVEIKLPKSNVLSYSLTDKNACIVRPSGTEPKIKLYITGVGDTAAAADKVVDRIAADMKEKMGIKDKKE